MEEWLDVKTIGLIGGMSWESSVVYYRDLNLGVEKRLGGLERPAVMSAVDFAELTHLEDARALGPDRRAARRRGGRRAEWSAAGADFLMLCTTTFHKSADEIADAVDIPLLHLANWPRTRARRRGGPEWRWSAPRSPWRDAVLHRPDGEPRHRRWWCLRRRHHDWLNSAIYEELVHGRVIDRTRRRVVEPIHRTWAEGAEGVLAG